MSQEEQLEPGFAREPKLHIATRIVDAIPMTKEQFNMSHPGNKLQGNPEENGYLITYPKTVEGVEHQEWCPKAQFEAENQNTRERMTFAHALEMMIKGFRVKRIDRDVIFSLGSIRTVDSSGYVPKSVPTFILERNNTTAEKLYANKNTDKLPMPEEPCFDTSSYLHLEDMIADNWFIV